jgi:hypothetical protein
MSELIPAMLCTGVLLAIGSANGQGLVPDCTLPFATIAKHHTIDDDCDARGEADLDEREENRDAHALQNQAKNNFCAPPENPALVTFITFRNLQRRLYQKTPKAKTWWRENLPKYRAVFRDIYTTSENATIGEGSVVTFAAWLMKVRQSGAESCNCGEKNGSGKEVTDLHLVLIASSPTESCCTKAEQEGSDCKTEAEKTVERRSVTAEISPHFRPDKWDAATICNAGSHHPLRFKGQLMYDAAHRPGSGPPLRVSSWEIHPVYAIDVCTKKSLNSCKADNKLVWTPLDQWQGDE